MASLIAVLNASHVVKAIASPCEKFKFQVTFFTGYIFKRLDNRPSINLKPMTARHTPAQHIVDVFKHADRRVRPALRAWRILTVGQDTIFRHKSCGVNYRRCWKDFDWFRDKLILMCLAKTVFKRAIAFTG